MSSAARQFTVSSDVEPLPPTLLDRVLWPVCLLLAWLAFELTANATLSLAMACLKFGTNDFRTAWWLWRTDHHRQRADACAMFYIASGIWKTALVPLFTAGLISIAWALYSPQALRPDHPVTMQLQKAMLVGLWAAFLLVVCVIAAVILSLSANWRIWVHPNLHRSRREDQWPPSFSPHAPAPANQASVIMLTAIFALILIGPVLTSKAIGFFNPPGVVRTALILSVAFGYPMFGVFSFGLLRGKLFAETAWECWPESIRELSASSLPSADRDSPEVLTAHGNPAES